jgi:hypothetical protein
MFSECGYSLSEMAFQGLLQSESVELHFSNPLLDFGYAQLFVDNLDFSIEKFDLFFLFMGHTDSISVAYVTGQVQRRRDFFIESNSRRR